MKEKLNLYIKIIKSVIKSSLLIFILILFFIFIISIIKNKFTIEFYKYSFLVSSIILFFISILPSLAFTNTEYNSWRYRVYYQLNDNYTLYEKLRYENFFKNSILWFLKFILPSIIYVILYFIFKKIS